MFLFTVPKETHQKNTERIMTVAPLNARLCFQWPNPSKPDTLGPPHHPRLAPQVQSKKNLAKWSTSTVTHIFMFICSFLFVLIVLQPATILETFDDGKVG